MTKQEKYEQLVGIFDKVQPVAEWEERGHSGLLGVKAYLVNVYKEGQGHIQGTLYVTDEGTAKESADFPKGDGVGRHLPKEEVVLTPEEVQIKEYNDKRGMLLTAKEDLELGIIDQTNYDAMLNELKTLKTSIESEK